jgi:hypothetical protein
VLAAEHLLGFRRVDLALQFVERPGEIRGDVFTGICPFDQDCQIVGAPLQRIA